MFISQPYILFFIFAFILSVFDKRDRKKLGLGEIVKGYFGYSFVFLVFGYGILLGFFLTFFLIKKVFIGLFTFNFSGGFRDVVLMFLGSFSWLFSYFGIEFLYKLCLEARRDIFLIEE